MLDEKQMSFFEEGGMSAPETEVDSSSGNEVPPGSLPEEVRDDVDAQLSSGEYVVPADVVRYFGMKFFEDLRETAKNDLEKMDSEGRIGGEPVESEEGQKNGLSAQEMALLQEVMSEGGEPEPQFNQGGSVMRNPEFYPQTDKGFAEGGLAETPKFNADSWRDVGSSFFNSQSSVGSVGVGTYYKTYVGPNGETRLILFVDGEPSTPIPEGFTEQKSAASEVQEEQAKEDVKDFTDSESDQRRREREEDRKETQSWAEQNYESVTSDPVGFGLEKLQGNNEMFGKAAEGLGAFGGPMGIAGAGIAKAAQINNLAEAKAAKLQAKAMGLDTTELDQAIEEFDNKLGPVDDIANALGIATGERYYESLREYTPSEVSETDTVFKSSRTPEEAEDRVQEIGKKLNTPDDTMAGARTFEASNTEGTVTNVGDEDTDPTEDTYGISVRSGSAAPQTGSTRPQSRPPGMNKGGLVKRRKKTPKKKTTKT